MKKTIFVLAVFLAGLILGAVVLRQPVAPAGNAAPAMEGNAWTDKQQLQYANLLLSKGLKQEAALALADYLKPAAVGGAEAAKICLRIADIYMDLYKYEQALAYFYKAEVLDSASVTGPAEEKIVAALEGLGMTRQAQYELKARTSLSPGKEETADVVARIGEDKITAKEIDDAMKRLPQWAGKEFEEESGRKQFIRQYVAAEALYRKAKRMGLEKEPRIRKGIELFKKDMVIREFLTRRIAEKINIDDSDLRNYYQAHKDRYLPKQETGGEDADKKDMDKGEKKRKGGPGKIMKMAAGEKQVDNEKDVEDNFEQVKRQVRRDLRSQKEQQIIQDLTRQALEDEDVEVY
ncbi:MAG: hypothetical protein ACE5GG_01175 [Candidatus Omnitrophota bacterium]